MIGFRLPSSRDRTRVLEDTGKVGGITISNQRLDLNHFSNCFLDDFCDHKQF